MKIFLGILIGLGLAVGGAAFASTETGLQVVEYIKVGALPTPFGHVIRKFYDNDNGVVCYSLNDSSISCLHN